MLTQRTILANHKSALRTIGLILCITLAATQTSMAALARTALQMIPQNASAVVRLQAPQTTLKDLAAFIDRVQPGFGGMVLGQAASLGMPIANPTLAGVDQSRDWYLLMFAFSDRPPEMGLLIPCTDAAAFKDAVADGFQFVDADGYVAYSKTAGIVEQMRSCIAGDAESLAATVTEAERTAFADGHLTAYVNGESLKRTYANELANAEDSLAEVITQLQKQLATTNPEVNMDYVGDLYRSIGEFAIQAVRDSSAGVVALKLTEEALVIDEILTVSSGSATAKILAGQPDSELQLLRSIPENLMGYWAMHGDPSPMMDWMMDFTNTALADEDMRAKFRQSMEAMRDVKFGTLAGGWDMVDDAAGMIRYLGIAEMTPTAKIRAAFQESFEQSTTLVMGGIQQEMSFEADAEMIDGQAIDLYRFKQTVPPELDPTGMQKLMNDRFYGPNGMVQRLAFLEDRLLQTIGGDAESIRPLLKPGTWSDTRLLKAQARHPQRANFLMLGDLPNAAVTFAGVMLDTGVLPVPFQSDQLDGLQLDRSYAGFSTSLAPEQVHVRTTLPLETIQGFVKIGFFVQGLMAGGN